MKAVHRRYEVRIEPATSLVWAGMAVAVATLTSRFGTPALAAPLCAVAVVVVACQAARAWAVRKARKRGGIRVAADMIWYHGEPIHMAHLIGVSWSRRGISLQLADARRVHIPIFLYAKDELVALHEIIALWKRLESTNE